MKKLILSLLLLLSSAVFGQPSNMKAVLDELDRQMALGICSVQNDKREFPPEAKFYYGRTQVSREVYLTYRNAGTNMHAVAEHYALTDPNGEGWKVAVLQWGR